MHAIVVLFIFYSYHSLIYYSYQSKATNSMHLPHGWCGLTLVVAMVREFMMVQGLY